MNKISKNVYLFVIGILSVALCVSVTLNFTGKTEAAVENAASVKKVEVSKKLAKPDIIDDINSNFYGTIFTSASHDSGTVTFMLRQDFGGGLYLDRQIIIQNVDVDNDVSFQ
ncbi:MAG: hypothetical protein ABWZ66_07735 [Pyrinomonadaceae bacterium]